MQVDGIFPDAYTFSHVLKVCGLLGPTDKGQSMYMEAVLKGFERECFVGSALVGMYVKLKLLEEARAVFDQLEVKEVVAWTALITGYVDHDQNERALDCFNDMQKEGVSPNVVTFLCCLKACGNLGAMSKGEEIYLEILRRGLLEEDQTLGNMVISMYSKCGSLTSFKT